MRIGGFLVTVSSARTFGAAISSATALLLAASIASGQSSGRQIEPLAGTWMTYVLGSGSELNVPAPPNARATAEEIAWLKTLPDDRDPIVRDQIRYWDAGAPAYRWIEIALNTALVRRPGARQPVYRTMALLNVAIHDATIAAWASKYAHNRLRPGEVEPSLVPLLPNPRSPSYPSEYAATAGAAAAVLSYLFPGDTRFFSELAEEAARSRLHARVEYPSDYHAGLELGRAVGAKVVDYARNDRFDAVWTGSVPTGPGLWVGTNPSSPTAGSWKTWLLTSGDQVRPGPPPAFNSPQMAAELAEVKNFTRTFNADQIALYQETQDSTFTYWYDFVSRKIFEEKLDDNPPRVARAYALMAVAEFDSIVACWDAKFTYWAMRPNQMDPAITTLFRTPNHPSYPAAHACDSAAIATTIGYLFPREAQFIWSKAEESGWSRLWAGIHFRSDIEAGLEIGRKVGELAIERARNDRAEER
jgi:membrane-associated phospholipid phosphatase